MTSEPVDCEVCGYRAEMAGEFLILYGSGALFVVLAFVFGACAVLTEGAGPEHWSRALRGWFPIGLWPAAYNWLAFLVVGILYSLGGVGLTRRLASAWWMLTGVISYQAIWALVTALRGREAPGSALAAWATVAGALLLAGALVRVRLSLSRLPQRDAIRMQRLAQQKEIDGPPAAGDEELRT